MPLAYSYESHVFRVDGDVLETFSEARPSSGSCWPTWRCRSFLSAGASWPVQIGAAPPENPLYEALPKARAIAGKGATMQLVVSPEDEPGLREFFTQVAQLCGRPVVS